MCLLSFSASLLFPAAREFVKDLTSFFLLCPIVMPITRHLDFVSDILWYSVHDRQAKRDYSLAIECQLHLDRYGDIWYGNEVMEFLSLVVY
jgi:hypothetical protein